MDNRMGTTVYFNVLVPHLNFFFREKSPWEQFEFTFMFQPFVLEKGKDNKSEVVIRLKSGGDK